MPAYKTTVGKMLGQDATQGIEDVLLSNSMIKQMC
jgi:hypothetical protein